MQWPLRSAEPLSIVKIAQSGKEFTLQCAAGMRLSRGPANGRLNCSKSVQSLGVTEVGLWYEEAELS